MPNEISRFSTISWSQSDAAKLVLSYMDLTNREMLEGKVGQTILLTIDPWEDNFVHGSI
jgi:hypothetical protein